MRLDYPGACSLSYKNQVEILISCLLQWDTKKQMSKGMGVLGTTLGYAPADEEQGRGTLHSHWQVWLAQLSQRIRNLLFSRNEEQRKQARKEFLKHVDMCMNTTYGSDFMVSHDCVTPIGTPYPRTGLVGEIFEERSLQVLRDARHKRLCHEEKGRVMVCKQCKKPTSTIDIVNSALAYFRDNILRDKVKNRPDITVPLSPERLDIAAFTYTYHFNEGVCYKVEDPFWGNKDVRTMLLRLRFDEHASSHRRSCFKKVSATYYYISWIQMSCVNITRISYNL